METKLKYENSGTERWEHTFLVKTFSKFSSKKCFQLLFPSIIPFALRACGGQPFVAEMPCGRAVPAETPGSGTECRKQRAQGDGEKEHTQTPAGSPGLGNLIVPPGHRYLPSDQNSPSREVERELKAEQREIGTPRLGRGLGEGTRLLSPSDKTAQTTPDERQPLSLCPEGGCCNSVKQRSEALASPR